MSQKGLTSPSNREGHGTSSGSNNIVRSLLLVVVLGVLLVGKMAVDMGCQQRFMDDGAGTWFTADSVTPVTRISSANGTKKGPFTRTLISTEVAVTHLRVFNSFIFPSWELAAVSSTQTCQKAYEKLIGTIDQSDVVLKRVVPDLYIACEPEVCQSIPLSCIKVTKDTLHLMIPDHNRATPLCFYAETVRKETKYRFIHSLNFMLDEPFISIIRSNMYEYIMRSDSDAILFPGLNYMVPKGEGMIGSGYNGERLTHALVLDYMRKNYDYKPAELKVRKMQSTFYIRSDKLERFAKILIDATTDFWEHEFTKERCNELKVSERAKEFGRVNKTICKWPYWHDGVSSLYGTIVAANVALENPVDSTKLDIYAASVKRMPPRLSVLNAFQAHILGPKHALSGLLSDKRYSACRNITELFDVALSKQTGGGRDYYQNSIKASLGKIDICTREAVEYTSYITHQTLMEACETLKMKKGRR